MTPKVLSEIHWEEKNYYMMASITGKKWTEMHFRSRGTTIITDESETFIGGYGFSHRKVCPLVTLYREILCGEQVLINFSQVWDLVLYLRNSLSKKDFKLSSWM